MKINSSIGVDIKVNGNPCKKYSHEGRTFIEAKIGSEYEIVVSNSLGLTKVLAVISVDGLNAINGKPSADNDSGYIVGYHDNVKVKGFRYSNDEVGAFKFSSKGDSYAKTQGKNSQCGVIGVRVYDEKLCDSFPKIIFDKIPETPYGWPLTPWSEYPGHYVGDIVRETSTGIGPTYSTHGACAGSGGELRSMSLSATSETPRGFDAGTAWGSCQESKVVEKEFEIGDLLAEIEIFYATRESLIEMGVELNKKSEVVFPKAFGDKKYAQPPQNWEAGTRVNPLRATKECLLEEARRRQTKYQSPV